MAAARRRRPATSFDVLRRSFSPEGNSNFGDFSPWIAESGVSIGDAVNCAPDPGKTRSTSSRISVAVDTDGLNQRSRSIHPGRSGAKEI